MADTTVKYFHSGMTSAPVLSGTAGSFVALLDACLVNGFGTKTVDSLVVSNNVATATVSTGHNFVMVGVTGPVAKIEGATPSGLNGECRVTVTGSTTFTFPTVGISNQTATGTITVKRAPAGYSKSYSGTNKGSYRADSLSSTRFFARIDDAGTTSARLRGYETMSDVDTGTGLFPTDAQISGGMYVTKSDTASSAARAWKLFSNGKAVYLLMAYYTGGFSASISNQFFGDILPAKPGDAYHYLIISQTAAGITTYVQAINSNTASYLARSYTQIGTSLNGGQRVSHFRNSSQIGYGGESFPANANNGINLYPVECWESSTILRGRMPGLWSPVHDGTVPHDQVVENITGLPNRTILISNISATSYQAGFDITGPWD
jgi:hypothetical protein